MMRRSTRRWALCTAAAAAMVIGLIAAPGAVAASNATIEVLSGRADMISGGDALVKVTGLKNHDRILAAGIDVTDAFEATATDSSRWSKTCRSVRAGWSYRR